MRTSPPSSGSSVWSRSTACTLALLGVTFAAGAQAGEEYNHTYTVTGRAHVRVHADDSQVRVVTADVKEVEFHAVYEGADWGLKIGERPHIESHQDGDVVELNARLNWNIMIGYNGRHMRIEVRMPRDADLELETHDGSVELASLNGSISVHTGDGAIHAAQLTGQIELRSGDGSITADALQGEMRLRTSDGHVRATHLTGRCEAASGDGSIDVEGQFEHLELRSGDGRITATVEPGSQIADASSWSVRTGDGSVHLTLPKDFKASLDASTGDGRIHTDLPMQIQGEIGKRTLRAILNGGGPGLYIHTGDGSIELQPI